jgi:hypothetical protein
MCFLTKSALLKARHLTPESFCGEYFLKKKRFMDMSRITLHDCDVSIAPVTRKEAGHWLCVGVLRYVLFARLDRE